MIRAAAILAALAAGAAAASVAAVLVLLHGGDPSGWQERSFSGRTDYRQVQVDGVPALQATAAGGASGLFLERSVSLARWPTLRWRWKVAGALSLDDERSRAGDDFAARVYVIARDPAWRWQARALCYVWAGRAKVGEAWPNPYSPDVVMVALRSGDAAAGRFVEERRDVAGDFRRHFGQAPRQVDAVAVMTDADQSGVTVTAWYEGVRFEGR